MLFNADHGLMLSNNRKETRNKWYTLWWKSAENVDYKSIIRKVNVGSLIGEDKDQRERDRWGDRNKIFRIEKYGKKKYIWGNVKIKILKHQKPGRNHFSVIVQPFNKLGINWKTYLKSVHGWSSGCLEKGWVGDAVEDWKWLEADVQDSWIYCKGGFQRRN